MIRKRFEIVSCVLAAALALASAAMAAPPADPRQATAQSHAFPVYLDSVGPPLELQPLPGVADSDAPDAGELVPDIPYSYFWRPQDGLRLRARDYVRAQRLSRNSPGLLGPFGQLRLHTPRTRWLPAAAMEGWSFGERNWRTRLDGGPEVLLGGSDIAVPEWNENLRLSGISLSQSFLTSGDDVSQWNYALAFGAVDQSASNDPDLVFGPKAGSLALSYDYSPEFTLESHTEVADDLFMSGITSQYDLGGFGRWRSGIARSTQGMSQGWRYRAMADFDLAEDMNLAWVGERNTEGFMDVRRYADGARPEAGGRQRWSATWNAGRWGEWSGSFESAHSRQGAQQRRFALSQQFWYSPNLRIGLHAEREVVSDDYDIGLRFSFPLY